MATTLILALAANTSFGGLPVLADALRQHGNVNVASVPFRLTGD